MRVSTEKELSQCIQNGVDRIEIEGDLANKTLKIKATGKVAWAVAFGAIGVAIIAVMTLPASSTTGPAGPVAEGLIASGAAAGAVTVLGLPATIAAISMALADKNKSVLTKLRDSYDIVEKSNNRIVLKKKANH